MLFTTYCIHSKTGFAQPKVNKTRPRTNQAINVDPLQTVFCAKRIVLLCKQTVWRAFAYGFLFLIILFYEQIKPSRSYFSLNLKQYWLQAIGTALNLG